MRQEEKSLRRDSHRRGESTLATAKYDTTSRWQRLSVLPTQSTVSARRPLGPQPHTRPSTDHWHKQAQQSLPEFRSNQSIHPESKPGRYSRCPPTYDRPPST